MGKNKKKAKLPKEVAGVKIPKKLRKIGGKAMKLAEQPVVSEIAAAALLAAASALREGAPGKVKAAAKGAAAAAGKAAGKAVREVEDEARDAGREARKLGDSLRLLAIDLARRTLDSWEEKQAAGDAGAADAAASDASGSGKAKGGKKG